MGWSIAERPQSGPGATGERQSHRSRGTSVKECCETLVQRGSSPRKPLIGRDGKWQVALVSPDLTRVERMEFEPAETPCCRDGKTPALLPISLHRMAIGPPTNVSLPGWEKKDVVMRNRRLHVYLFGVWPLLFASGMLAQTNAALQSF